MTIPPKNVGVTELEFFRSTDELIVSGTNSIIYSISTQPFFEIRSKTVVSDAPVTCIRTSEWQNQPTAILGTNDGCVHIWSPMKSKVSITFRSDFDLGNESIPHPQYVSPFTEVPCIATSRGSLSISLWDLETQKISGKYFPSISTQQYNNSIIEQSGLKDFGKIQENIELVSGLYLAKRNENVMMVCGNKGTVI